jgi:hypothetical protein
MTFENHVQCKNCTINMRALGGEFATQLLHKNVHWYCGKCGSHFYARTIDAKNNDYEPHQWYSAPEWEAWVNEL